MLRHYKRTLSLIMLGLVGLAMWGGMVNQAAIAYGPPFSPPGQSSCHPPSPTPPPGVPAPPSAPSVNWPDCQGAGLQISGAWQPSIGVVGQPFTYTLSVHAGGVKPATNIELDLPLSGATLINYTIGEDGWALQSANNLTTTLRFKATRDLQAGSTSPSVTVTVSFPDINAAFLKEFASVSWNDLNGFVTKGYEMDIPVKVDLNLNPNGSNPNSGTTNPNPGSTNMATSPLALNVAFGSVPDPGASKDDSHWYFATTSHTLDDQYGFLSYWLAHGAVTTLGYPLSQVFTDGGYQTQFFERGVLEYHHDNPDPYKVQLRALGREAGQVQTAVKESQPPSAGSIFYPQTGHWLDARFADFWQSNGGLEQFGYPISEPVTQSDGKLVQWFERARFELTTTVTGYQQVQLGLVGRESAVHKGFLTN